MLAVTSISDRVKFLRQEHFTRQNIIIVIIITIINNNFLQGTYHYIINKQTNIKQTNKQTNKQRNKQNN